MARLDPFLQSQWLPFTPNRSFALDPRVFVAAEGMHFTTHDGRRVLDGISSLWCVGAGHKRREINEAISPPARHAGLRHRFPERQRPLLRSGRAHCRAGAG
jgi:adenosylmethionine-8-amino-7-oxononanoate aminotransferase